MAIEDQGIAGLAGGLEDRVGQAHGGAGGGILLEAMMGLDDLDVVVIARGSWRPAAAILNRTATPKAHVGRLEDGDVGGGLVDRGVIGGLQAGGADDHGDACGRGRS